MNLRRLVILLALGVLALPLAACGSKDSPTTFSDTEGTYLNVGDLTYQVQISRNLNPRDSEDSSYLRGVPADQRQLGPDQAWFGVFVIAFNEHHHPATAADDFSISDTEGDVYRPVTLGTDNLFAYHGGIVPPNGQLPVPDTVASNNPSVNGALVLFKVPNSAFNNRPLILRVRGIGTPSEARVDLDV
jgi:hypothetical protein